MIKKILLALAFIAPALNAELPRFKHEAIIIQMYLDVEPDIGRITMQQIVADYGVWCAQTAQTLSNKTDTVYFMRMTYIFGEVILNYQFGV